MKLVKENPGIRHLKIGNINSKEEGMEVLNYLKEYVVYIIGGYEQEGKNGNKNLHAHFIIFSKYNSRYILDNKPSTIKKNQLRFIKAEDKTDKLYQGEELDKLISYVLKEGNPYPFNDKQDYLQINNIEELLEQAVTKHKDNKETSGTFTNRLLNHFDKNKATIFNGIDILGEKGRYKKMKLRIIEEVIKFMRADRKLVDTHIYRKAIITVINHLDETHEKHLRKMQELFLAEDF